MNSGLERRLCSYPYLEPNYTTSIQKFRSHLIKVLVGRRERKKLFFVSILYKNLLIGRTFWIIFSFFGGGLSNGSPFTFSILSNALYLSSLSPFSLINENCMNGPLPALKRNGVTAIIFSLFQGYVKASLKKEAIRFSLTAFADQPVSVIKIGRFLLAK